MRLSRFGREEYSVAITLVPEATGTWEASFDGGTTWTLGTDLGGGSWGWLIAGPENAGGTPDYAVPAQDTTIVPLLRLTAGQEQIVDTGPTINVV